MTLKDLTNMAVTPPIEGWKATESKLYAFSIEAADYTVAFIPAGENAKNNATRIAASNDLLAACEKAVEYLNYSPENMVDALHAGIDVRNIVMAAIAKATQ